MQYFSKLICAQISWDLDNIGPDLEGLEYDLNMSSFNKCSFMLVLLVFG